LFFYSFFIFIPGYGRVTIISETVERKKKTLWEDEDPINNTQVITVLSMVVVVTLPDGSSSLTWTFDCDGPFVTAHMKQLSRYERKKFFYCI
jgi:hypothetical protein